MSAKLDFRRLRYFVAVCELGSFSRASEFLNVTQSALSQHVASLEQDLGVQLLVRQPRGVSRTEASDAAVRRAIAEKVHLEIESAIPLKRAVGAGLGVTVQSAALAGDEIASGELVARPVVNPAMGRTLYLVSSRIKTASRAGFPAAAAAAAARREIALQVGNRQVRPSPSLQTARLLRRVVSVSALPTIGLIRGPQGSVPVVAKSGEEAAAHFGWSAHFAALDCPTSSAWTRARLGWQPTGPGLITDLDHDRYFDG